VTDDKERAEARVDFIASWNSFLLIASMVSPSYEAAGQEFESLWSCRFSRVSRVRRFFRLFFVSVSRAFGRIAVKNNFSIEGAGAHRSFPMEMTAARSS
jgi:hypothetical protein